MRVLIAPDKFKGCLSAAAVAENIAAGIRAVLPEAGIVLAPVADGGEGTAEVICTALEGEWLACDAHDALGHEIRARYVWLRESATAVIEMREAAGLEHLAGFTTDPLCANTFGVGEMMHHATEQGAREIIVGLGGSATTDGGFGMARGLGFRFFRGPENCRAGASRSDSSQRSARSSCEEVEYQHEQELVNGPAELVHLVRIIPSPQSPLSGRGGRNAPGEGGRGLSRIIAAADVRNPLLGERGAARTFAPQKGATPEQIETLECALTRLADVGARELETDFRNDSGAGAAGGLGYGLMMFCGAELRSGFDVVADAIHLKEKIRQADVVITGEGRLDAQTLQGKAPSGVATLARKHQKCVYAIVGEVVQDTEISGLFDGVFELARGPGGMDEAMACAPQLLRDRAAELAGSLRDQASAG